MRLREEQGDDTVVVVRLLRKVTNRRRMLETHTVRTSLEPSS